MGYTPPRARALPQGLRRDGRCPFLLFCVLASFLQVASGNKFVGYLLMILVPASSSAVLRQPRPRAQPLQLRRARRDATVLGHERLRPLRGAALLVQPLLGLLRALACWRLARAAVGARHRAPRGRRAGPRPPALHRPGARRRWSSPRSGLRRPPARSSSTTPTCSTSTCPSDVGARRARPSTRRSTGSTRTWPQPRYATSTPTWTSSPPSGGSRSAAATGSRTQSGRAAGRHST